MKKKIWICIITVLILAVLIILFIFPSVRFVEKVEGAIPYNENNSYILYSGSLLEISDKGIITHYSFSDENGRYEIQQKESIHLNYPVKKYISWNSFITKDDEIMFGNLMGTEHKNLGTVKNAADVSISIDNNHVLIRTAVVTSDGLLFVQGDNSTGALGIEVKQVNNEFVQVPNLQNVVKAVCGINCILALNADGEVFISGTLGELSYQTFTKLDVPKKVKDISFSDSCETVLVLDVKGNVYELGISYFVKDYYDNIFWSWNEVFYSSVHKISKLRNIVSIKNPVGFTAHAIDKYGNIFCWGAQTKSKTGELKKIFYYIYGLPKHDKIWVSDYGCYILSNNKITAYLW